MYALRHWIATAAFLSAIPAAHASLVTNGSFESPVASSAVSSQYCYLNSAANIGCNMSTFSLARFARACLSAPSAKARASQTASM